MAKFVGIREQVGQLPGFVQRAQTVSLMGEYELAGTVERQFSPYDVERLDPPVVGYKWGPRQWWPVWSKAPLNLANIETARRFGVPPVVGGPCPPGLHVGPYDGGFSCVANRGLGAEASAYDLKGLGSVREIKRALKALGKNLFDPFKQKNPITETTWQQLTDDDAWDGVTADAFTIAVGRYNKKFWGITGPFMFDAPSGPQPTAHGLELIAGAVNQFLGGHPRMDHYLTWRGGHFDPPSVISGPPADSPITLTTNFGPSFLQLPADTSEIAPEVLTSLAGQEQAMREMWIACVDAKLESTRSFLAEGLAGTRALRQAMMRLARTQALKKPCEAKGWVWVETETEAYCTEPPTAYVPPVEKTPPVSPPPKSPTSKTSLGLIVIGLVGVAGWWLTRPKATGVARVFPASEGAWRMGDLKR